MSFESLPSTVRNDLVDVCDDFERAWRGGRRPRIEEYLGSRTDPERTELLIMLLGVELEMRRDAGELPEPREYLERFRMDTESIRTLFVDLDVSTATEPDPPPSTQSMSGLPLPCDRSTTAASTTFHFSRDRSPEQGGLATHPLPEMIGRYRVTGYLGSGNFVVYRAYDDRNGRQVAIKIAKLGDTSGRRLVSLAEEAEKLKALNHPRIVKVYDYVPGAGPEVAGDGFIVMEHIEGRTLEEVLRDGPLPAPRLARIVAQVADAVHHAHTQRPGLIHRDLKPSNILIDPRGEPHVCDFGLAVDEIVQWNRRGEVAGTRLYMAPEQVRGETHRLDGRTDIWALGVILYRGLTGGHPFPNRRDHSVFEEILHRDPKPPRMCDPAIDPELERICLRCLSRPMFERYLTAADLAADLMAAIDRPPPPTRDLPPIVLKGLQPFDVEDARFFLAMLPGPRGGDGLPETIRFWKMRVEASEGDLAFPVGLLYGPSGGGKSSFVRAGLLPQLDGGLLRPIYIEATQAGTEARLLAELRRVAPSLATIDGLELPDALAILRDDETARPAGKVLVVLDQFEQWLQAHSHEPDAELVRALRHCDGRGVQALVLVRDEFWMAATRFFQAVEVPIVQGRNSSAVELFDARHARRVLEGFGRAFGQIPADAGGDSAARETSRFLDDAVGGLTGVDGRVIPVRLSLFAQVVRFRPWVPATLVDLGGADGIGVKFMDDCFRSAPYRRHRGAAQAVLKKLLPPPTSAIRGGPHTGGELRAASGCADRPESFAELVAVLDGELKLIVSTDPDGSASDAPGVGPAPSGAAGETYYQLSHDYLVRPIRLWLERDQSSSRKGRARLRLELITAVWLERRSPRHLPSPMELASILWHVPPGGWSADERRLMGAAKRHYLVRGVSAAALLAALAAGGRFVRNRDVAAELLVRSVHADFENLPALIPDLETYSRLMIPGLEKYERDGSGRGPAPRQGDMNPPRTAHARQVAGILLFRFAPTPERGRYLRELLRAAPEPDKLVTIRDSLAQHPGMAGVDELRRMLRGREADPATQIRAACVLVKLDLEGAADWACAADALKEALMVEDRRTASRWIDLLGPAVRALVPPLRHDCHDPKGDPAARANAADALGEILARGEHAEELARSIVDAQPDAARLLRRALTRLGRREAAATYLREAVARGPDDTDVEARKDEAASRQAEAAITLATMGEPEALWPRLAHQPDPRLRARLIDTLADSGLAPRVLRDRLNRPGLDPAERQALLMGLAEGAPPAATSTTRAEFVAAASALFLHDPDPGVHSAAELLLRRWGHEDISMRTGGAPRAAARAAANRRRWVEGPNGHTFAILPGPLEFWMGSPTDEPDRADVEERQYRRIDRSIEVATTEVTVAQFREYKAEGPSDREPGVVAGHITWYDAVGYCNWLSGKAGIDRTQWCYPEEVKPGFTVAADALKKTGYRLPTEAEWEYLCRAGAGTKRAFGGSDVLLPRYAWTWLNSADRAHPPGRLLPNEFGLFDTLGNHVEWCHDGPADVTKAYQDPYPPGTPDRPAADEPFLDNRTWRYLRGGSFRNSPSTARSAYRDEAPAYRGNPSWGFRVVRTIHLN